MIKSLKFMQINGQRARLVMAEIRKVMDDEDIDVLLLQEPYNFKGEVRGFADLRVVSTGGDLCMVAIVVRNTDVTVTRLSTLMNSHVACTVIDWWGGSLCVVSEYCQFGHDIQSYLGYLDILMGKLEGKHIILGMDANAKSTVWFSGYTDHRGSLLEELAQQHRLLCVNTPGNPFTFSTVNGESNVDVTFVTSSCYNIIADWDVHDTWTTSDHRAIRFSL